MDNTEVCELFQISPRTLQSYRDKGVLSYSQIGRKCYYKTTDIEQLVSQSQIKK
ncbi:helix-turn-helix domain-containing protein [Dysgonomonas sp. BGC7]|uniref:helix-turn-helix domain-containing protein n=1 Tax=Dysgonomonas sp. BGC7 TaxID=1658008 RepID=UPI00350F0720